MRLLKATEIADFALPGLREILGIKKVQPLQLKHRFHISYLKPCLTLLSPLKQ